MHYFAPLKNISIQLKPTGSKQKHHIDVLFLYDWTLENVPCMLVII